MKLLSDWIILNLGATLAFSALWVAVVVVVAAFMGVRAGFVGVVGWVSGLFARKRDPIRIGAAATDVRGSAPFVMAPPPGFSPWIAGSSRSVSIDGPAPVGGYPWPSPVSLQDAVLTKAFAGAALAAEEFNDKSKLAPMVTATRPDGTPDPSRFGSPYGMAGSQPGTWRGTGGAREDRETVIEATWQGRGRGFATTTLPVVQ